MTIDKNGEEQRRKQAISAEVRASGIGQSEIARRISAIIGKEVGRSIVNKMVTGGRGVSEEEAGLVRRALRYGEKESLSMEEEQREPTLSAGHDGDREMVLFDMDRLRRTLIAALLVPDMNLPRARQVAEDWLEALRILPTDEVSGDDKKG